MLTVIITVLGGSFLIAAGVRLLNLDGTRYTAAMIALTPYVAVCGLVLGGLSLLFQHWTTGTVVLLISALLVTIVAPRAFARSQPAVDGPQVRILSINLYYGQADAQSVVEAVRNHQIDVLSVQELTEDAVAALNSAGLKEILPHQIFHASNKGAQGSGLASRYPLDELTLAGPSVLAQPSARIKLPGNYDAEVVVVHPVPPVGAHPPATWREELAGLPIPTAGKRIRILAGDFNATLDHAPLRRLLAAGYVDAAGQKGRALKPTWPRCTFIAPPLTLDHIVIDRRCSVDTFDVLEIPGTDHRAVLAGVTLPS